MNELEFHSDHWMARNYRRFVELGGRERSPENLCRFLRVVFLWSPVRRFFKGNAPLDCTPFGFIALVSIFLGICIGLGMGVFHILFNDWIMGLIFVWMLWVVVAVLVVLTWLCDKGGKENIRYWFKDNIVRPVQAIQTYRKARASLFCPLISFKDDQRGRL